MSLFPALGLTFIIALCWLRAIDFLAQRGVISSRTSRKIIHIGTGPVFVLCWLFFPADPASRYLAAIIPLIITAQFFLVGIGVIKDEGSVQAMSRSGDRREILRGPLYYGIVFVLMTVLFWKDHPAGVIALMMLCGGDGLADLIGSRIKSPSIPWAPRKSVAGSLSVFLGGALLGLLVVVIFDLYHVWAIPLSRLVPAIGIIGFACMLVESMPFEDIDNITLPIVSVLMGYLLL